MRDSITIRRAAAAVIAGAGVLLAACGAGNSAQTTTPSTKRVRGYVGAAQGTDAFVAVVIDGARALAYVCDGVPADPTGTPPVLQAWFNGPSDGTTVDVQAPAGRLQLLLTDTDMAGTLILADGRSLPVSGRGVAGDADAGLYRAEASGAGTAAVGGWILAVDGRQRGGSDVENGGTAKISGVRVLNLSQPTFSVQGLATARIAKVGITPIPIP